MQTKQTTIIIDGLSHKEDKKNTFRHEMFFFNGDINDQNNLREFSIFIK